MSLSRFIYQSPQDFGAAFNISGFLIQNENDNYCQQENFYYNSNLSIFSGENGVPKSVLVSSGEFSVPNPVVSWALLNPVDRTAYRNEELYTLQSFNGFDLSIHDETGLLVKTIATGYKKNYYKINTS